MKSYNKEALRGLDTDDKEWQGQMEEAGITVPDDKLYSPEGVRHAMREIKTRNINYMTNRLGLSEKEAKEKAEAIYKTAMKSYDKMLKQ